MTSPDSGPLSMNVGLLRVEDGLIRLSVDIRHPETAAADHIAETVRRAVEPYGFTLAPIHSEKAFIRTKTAPSCKAFWRPIGRRRETFPPACHRRRNLCKGHGEHYRFRACVSRRGIPGASGGRIYRLGQHREAAPHLCTGVPKPAGIIRIYQAQLRLYYNYTIFVFQTQVYRYARIDIIVNYSKKAPPRDHSQDGAFLLWIRANISRRNRR